MRTRTTALAACLITVGCASPATSAPVAVVAETWVRVPGLPDDERWERGLYDVSAIGPDLAWAVGYTGWEDNVATSLRVWNGSRWQSVQMTGMKGGLASVDSDGPRNAWMLSGGFHASFAHQWDGRTWRRHQLPTYGRDVAVDGRRVAVVTDADVLTWNGTAFVRETRLGDKRTRLTSVDTEAGHTWVAGYRDPDQPVVWHGHRGRYKTTPALPKGRLNRILQLAPDDVWAVGGDGEKPLLLHWDGRSWQRPAIPQVRGEVNSVTAFGPDDVWFAGRDLSRPGHITVLHWDGRTWTQETPPQVGTGLHAQIERIPGTSRLWLTVNVLKGDSEKIATFRRK
ncbi:hypothetical protein FDA94_01800 [Herbidospora galbida]|uniref:Exo-alpha-sialidase n=1 Tax=Herbidospora galbida TaxID=2575442 RepID=A0A4U3MPC1_9ACTN|nr:hypothetical protein [Herbidospora galbida]TKK91538.1 hypothetical protein FDA94_01800 [Herbidospora galbida]